MSTLLFSAPVIVYFAVDVQNVQPRIIEQPQPSSVVALPVSKPKRVLKTYTEEQKAKAVMRVFAGEKKTHVAQSIGVRESTLRGWVTMYQKEQRLPGGKKRNVRIVRPSIVTPEKTCESGVVFSQNIPIAEKVTTSMTTPEKIPQEVQSLTLPPGEKTPIHQSVGDKMLNPMQRVLGPLTPPPSPTTVEVVRKTRGRPRSTSSSSSSQKKKNRNFSAFQLCGRKRKRNDGSEVKTLNKPKSSRQSYRKVWAEERRLRDSINLDAPEIVEHLDFFQSLGLMRRSVASNITSAVCSTTPSCV